MTDNIKKALTDASVMIEEELQYVRTGKHPGQPMRDCRGQWESLLSDLREARREMEEIGADHDMLLAIQDILNKTPLCAMSQLSEIADLLTDHGKIILPDQVNT